jgi:NADPH2:quinone reductase
MFSIHAYDEQPDVSGQHLADLMEMIKEGRIKPAIFAELPLDMAAEAHRLIEDGAVMGKILLQPARTEPRYAAPTDT